MSAPRLVGRPPLCPDEVRDLVIELHRSRWSLRRIAHYMNEAGYLTPAGKARWSHTTVDNLLATRHVREVIEA